MFFWAQAGIVGRPYTWASSSDGHSFLESINIVSKSQLASIHMLSGSVAGSRLSLTNAMAHWMKPAVIVVKKWSRNLM